MWKTDKFKRKVWSIPESLSFRIQLVFRLCLVSSYSPRDPNASLQVFHIFFIPYVPLLLYLDDSLQHYIHVNLDVITIVGVLCSTNEVEKFCKGLDKYFTTRGQLDTQVSMSWRQSPPQGKANLEIDDHLKTKITPLNISLYS